MHYSNNIDILIMQIVLLAGFVLAETEAAAHPIAFKGIFYVLHDEIMHALLYVIIFLPFASMPVYFLIGLVSSVVIDIDHLFVARSLSIKRIVSFPARPVTHSLIFAVLIGVITGLLLGDYLKGLFVFAGLAAHLLRDLIDGKTFILLPFSRIHSIGLKGFTAVCLIMIIGLHILLSNITVQV